MNVILIRYGYFHLLKKIKLLYCSLHCTFTVTHSRVNKYACHAITGEYPWQAAILKKDVQESVYVCGGTLIDALHVLTAAHCVKT